MNYALLAWAVCATVWAIMAERQADKWYKQLIEHLKKRQRQLEAEIERQEALQ
jgi:hypothetical protein